MTRNLILVHGFKDDKFNHQASLESWVKGWDTCQGERGYQFRPFRFRSSKILKNGIDGLREAGFNLLSKLQKIKDEFQVANDDGRVGGSQDRSGTPPPLKRPLFIFVAHGLGAWLVKEILSSGGGNWIATDTVGLIFLDVPAIPNDPLSSPAAKEYEQTIRQLHRRFSGEFLNRDMAAKVPALAADLEEVDTRFKETREKLRVAMQLGHGDPLPTKFQEVWSEPSATEQVQSTQVCKRGPA
ncbi:hypothetical protein B0H67DRAFT_644366 [Lasiosphaeris hirsuta]|uniref:DUF676 domain-containing protein n=1 Tax=Lasiosphaeris hirsuta TaxID=260670 RepID=A0AA40DT33_9PEZI|nr:hypothetical protein B0H67DRAFT_644366 [Lasiosphaeris hirsuta]